MDGRQEKYEKRIFSYLPFSFLGKRLASGRAGDYGRFAEIGLVQTFSSWYNMLSKVGSCRVFLEEPNP
jgi:hypothetical protein